MLLFRGLPSAMKISTMMTKSVSLQAIWIYEEKRSGSLFELARFTRESLHPRGSDQTTPHDKSDQSDRCWF